MSEAIEICRTCAKETHKENTLSVFDTCEIENAFNTISEFLKSFAQLQVEKDDILPQVICLECLHHLKVSCIFKTRCIASEIILKEKFLTTTEKSHVGKECDTIIDASHLTTNRDDALEEVEDDPVFDESTIANNCQICNQNFDNKTNLNKHMKKIHEQKTEQTIYECKECGVKLEAAKFKLHRKEHRKQKRRKYVCEICSKIFSSHSGLAYHINVHMGVKNYTCDVCDKKFVGQNNLLIHKRRHNQDYAHLCSDCGKKFLTLGELNRHMRNHRNERPFKCSICQKFFTTNLSLQQHNMRHSGEKMYLCYICSKRFTTSTNLVEHMRSHTGIRPHRCPICNKGCVSTSDLKKHLRTHSGERPYVCEECGRGFARSGSLKVHMRSHTGIKPYDCGVCGKKYGHSGSLAKHIKKHHSSS